MTNYKKSDLIGTMTKHQFIKKISRIMCENLSKEFDNFSIMGNNITCFEKDSNIFYELDITKFRAFCGGKTEIEK